MAKIIAPNKEFNGLSAGVTFVNGVGYTDDENAIRWFSSRGYTVELPVTDVPNVACEATKPKKKGR